MADTVALPPIPTEAVQAAATATYLIEGEDVRDRAGKIVRAAWPYLYAAALRYTAEECDFDEDYGWRAGLLGLADEATRG